MKPSKVLPLILALAFLFCVLPAHSAAAGEPKYVAFGDSIAFGFGLSSIETQCYTNLVASGVGVSLTNYAVNGMKSGGLLNTLTAMTPDSEAAKKAAEAAVITVSIGSNDLLGTLSSIFNNALAANGGKLDEAAYTMLEADLTGAESISRFLSGIDAYRENLPKIYARLRELNPGAQIIMTEFYNPYYGVMLGSFDFAALCDTFIVSMNQVLIKGAETMDYDIAEIYTTFNMEGLTCVNDAATPFDPHPNSEGHSVIAMAVLEKIDYDSLAVFAEAAGTETESAQATESASDSENAQETTETSEKTPETDDGGTEESFFVKNAGTIILIAIAAISFIVVGIVMGQKNKSQDERKD